jgi:hypothetical protein
LRSGDDSSDIGILAGLTRAFWVGFGFLPALELNFLLFLPSPLFVPLLL